MDSSSWSHSEEGERFLIGRDVISREPPGGRVVRVYSQDPITPEYTACISQALEQLAKDCGSPVTLVIDFQDGVLPSPGGGVELCRELKSRGAANRLVLVRKKWMPPYVVQTALFVLSRGGRPCEVVEDGPELEARMLALNEEPAHAVVPAANVTPARPTRGLRALLARLLGRRGPS